MKERASRDVNSDQRMSNLAADDSNLAKIGMIGNVSGTQLASFILLFVVCCLLFLRVNGRETRRDGVRIDSGAR